MHVQHHGSPNCKKGRVRIEGYTHGRGRAFRGVTLAEVGGWGVGLGGSEA